MKYGDHLPDGHTAQVTRARPSCKGGCNPIQGLKAGGRTYGL